MFTNCSIKYTYPLKILRLITNNRVFKWHSFWLIKAEMENTVKVIKMKKLSISAFLILAALILSSCDVNDSYYQDYTPPSPPSGIQVLNGDSRVDIYWNQNRESDVAGYNVYYNYTYEGKYTLIGSTSGTYYADLEAVNGNKYYYAVAAYDYNGNESELSYDVIYSTPRPEGFNQAIFDYIRFPNNSGYTFTTYSTVPYDAQDVDFFFEMYQGTGYLRVYDDTDIRDMGQTNDIYDIPYAPNSGWAVNKEEIAIVGHTYVIWTWDNHFAKIRVNNITADRVVFDWAFQLVEGEPQLKPVVKGGERKLDKLELAR